MPAVVFDLGNVLIRWDPRPALAAAVGEAEAERLLSAEDFDFDAWNHAQDAGRPFAEGEAEVAASHPHWAEHVRGYRPHFAHSLTGPVDDTVAVVRDLHDARVPLYALTNWSAETFPFARGRFAFLDWFESILVSADVGLIKPDPAIFELLLERIGRTATECIYIDDNARNVASAAALGFDAIAFEGVPRLREELAGRGLPTGRREHG